MGKWKFSYIAGIQIVTASVETVWQQEIKLKVYIDYDLTIPLLAIVGFPERISGTIAQEDPELVIR